MLNSYLSEKVKLKMERYRTTLIFINFTIIPGYRYIYNYLDLYIQQNISMATACAFTAMVGTQLVFRFLWLSASLLLIHTRRTPTLKPMALLWRIHSMYWRRVFGDAIRRQDLHSLYIPPCSNHNFHPLAVIPKRAAKVACQLPPFFSSDHLYITTYGIYHFF